MQHHPETRRPQAPARRTAALALAAAFALAAAPVHAGTWSRRPAAGNGPSERSTPAVAALGSSIYLFGGVMDDFRTQLNTFYDDLYRYDTLTDTWEPLSPAGARPPARAFAAAVGHERRGSMLVFGGAFYGPQFAGFIAFGDLWSYSAAQNAWSRLQPANLGPAGRSRPTAWLVEDRLYVFGGITSTFTTLNDLWVYDLATNRWTELIPNGAPGSPPPRHEGQAGTVQRRGKLTVYGGETLDLAAGFQMLADVWELDLATLAWRDVTPPPSNDIQPPRNYGAAAVLGHSLVLQGGDVPGGSSGCGAPFPQNPTDELWEFDLVHRVWRQLAPAGDPLARLKRHVAAVAGERMYVFAGWDFQCDGLVGGPGQIWNLDVYSYEP